MKHHLFFLLLSSIGFALATACLATPQARTMKLPGAPSTVELLERYFADSAALRSFYSLSHSPQREDRLEAFDQRWSEILEELDYGALDVAGQVDYHLLRTGIEYHSAKRRLLRVEMEEAEEELPFRNAIFELELARWKVTAVDPQAAAKTLAEIAEQVQETLERLKDDSSDDEDAGGEELPGDSDAGMDAPRALRLAKWTRESNDTLDAWYEQYAKFVPEFSWWCEKPFESASDRLDELAKHLEQTIGGIEGEDDDPLLGTPIGAEALAIELAHEWLAYTPQELIAVGEAQLAWCQQRLLEAAQELGHGDDWRAALEVVKELHVAPGEQDALVAGQAREAIAWLKREDLVTIPPLCEETWRVSMVDERVQRTLPFAAYGRQRMMVAFPTSVMDQDDKLMSMRGNNIHFTRCVTPHELIPGHHLQGFMSKRHSTWRRPFRTPFLVEGWALYWEMVEYDGGWPRGPEDRIGMLFWRMHRAARIVLSLRYHLGEMEPQEMIDFLVERVGHELSNATSEVRRYIGPGYSALYQCGYMIGGLQLRALSKELVGSGGYTPKQYHDAILLENAIPIELIRASLSGKGLAKDARPSWKPRLKP